LNIKLVIFIFTTKKTTIKLDRLSCSRRVQVRKCVFTFVAKHFGKRQW